MLAGSWQGYAANDQSTLSRDHPTLTLTTLSSNCRRSHSRPASVAGDSWDGDETDPVGRWNTICYSPSFISVTKTTMSTTDTATVSPQRRQHFMFWCDVFNAWSHGS